MPIKLEEIVGDNYFSIFPKDKYDASLAIARRANSLQGQQLQDNEAEAKLLDLQTNLGEVIGVTLAEKLGTFQEIEEAAWENLSRLEQVKLFHNGFFQQAIKAANGYVKDNHPSFNLEEEVRRDTVFHELMRSGLLAISRLTGINADEASVTEAILQGHNIQRYLPRGFRKEDLMLFILGMQNSARRREFLDFIKGNYGLNEEQISAIDKAMLMSELKLENFAVGSFDPERLRQEIYGIALETRNFNTALSSLAKRLGVSEDELEAVKRDLQIRFKNIGASQPVRIGRGLMDLWNGGVEPRYVLPKNYLNKSYYPLAFLVSTLNLLKENRTHFHTPTAMYVSYLNSQMIPGDQGMHQEQLKLLSELTNIDGFEHVTVWRSSGKYDMLYPLREIPDNIFGELYGLMLARLGTSDNRFILTNMGVEELQAHIERLGKLSKKLSTSIKEIESNKLNERFGWEDKDGNMSGKFYRGYSAYIPHQVFNLVNSAKLEEATQEFAKYALIAYATLRGVERHSRSYVVNAPIEDLRIIRELGTKAGVGISKGSETGNQLVVYISGLKV